MYVVRIYISSLPLSGLWGGSCETLPFGLIDNLILKLLIRMASYSLRAQKYQFIFFKVIAFSETPMISLNNVFTIKA